LINLGYFQHKMALISKEEFEQAIKINKVKMPGLTWLIMELLKINSINSLYENAKAHPGLEFIEKVLETLDIEIDIDESDLKNIPENGAFITVSNHPFGGIEGLILMLIVAKKRPDFKVMANFLLKKIPNISDYFIAVNPFENIKNTSSITGIKQTLTYLNSGSPIGIFPAGEVSTLKLGKQKIIDKEWHPVVGKIISKAEIPVVPIYFSGSNSLLFNILSLIHPNLRTVKLPSELVNKKGHSIKVRIGKPIIPKELNELGTSERMLKFCRAKTYALGSGIEVRKFFSTSLFKIEKHPEEIIAAKNSIDIEKEIETLQDCLILEEKNYQSFIAPTRSIPTIIEELGRLREITFRDVGEGTNKKIDLDEFDVYYHHLFIWDKEEKKIVGAYRIGLGKDILERYGKKGFYLNSLFKVNKKFNPVFGQSLELGRSFIIKEYQQKALPLMLLWKSLMLYLLKNEDYRYLIGPVSISNDFSKLSKSLIIEYFKTYHFDDKLSELVKPKKSLKVRLPQVDRKILIEGVQNIKNFDALIADIESSKHRLPVLIRQYVQIGAKIICFNIDPKFSNALDGFIVLDLNNVPESTLEMLSKDLGYTPNLKR
jgi:putative hemolysin